MNIDGGLDGPLGVSPGLDGAGGAGVRNAQPPREIG